MKDFIKAFFVGILFGICLGLVEAQEFVKVDRIPAGEYVLEEVISLDEINEEAAEIGFVFENNSIYNMNKVYYYNTTTGFALKRIDNWDEIKADYKKQYDRGDWKKVTKEGDFTKDGGKTYKHLVYETWDYVPFEISFEEYFQQQTAGIYFIYTN